VAAWGVARCVVAPGGHLKGAALYLSDIVFVFCLKLNLKTRRLKSRMKSNGRDISPRRRQWSREHHSGLCIFANCVPELLNMIWTVGRNRRLQGTHCHMPTKLQWLSSSSNTSGFAQVRGFLGWPWRFPKPSHGVADFTDNRCLCRHIWATILQAKSDFQLSKEHDRRVQAQ